MALGLTGRDWVNLALGTMSLFGDDGGPQERTGYRGGADPQARQAEFYDLLRKYGQGLGSQSVPQAQPFKFESPRPVSVPGLGIQIGGAFGMDPSMRQGQAPPPAENPFSSLFGNANRAAQGGSGQATERSSDPNPTRRRRAQ